MGRRPEAPAHFRSPATEDRVSHRVDPVPTNLRMSIGGSNMEERRPNRDSEETPDSKPQAGDAASGSPAEQAKQQEREMEESGGENAA
jgi:hypothetical protein